MMQKQHVMMEGGPAMQMPMPHNMLESEMIGAIKIKDGLFIGDELASTVSPPLVHLPGNADGATGDFRV